MQDVDEKLLLKYLLGDLPEEKQVQLEDCAFANASYMEALETAEADLIDSYVRGELPAAGHRLFEQRFLKSPQRRRKVEFARALAQVADESRAHERFVPGRRGILSFLRGWNPPLQFAAAVGVMICVAGASWLAVRNAAIRSRVAAFETQRLEMESRERNLQQQLGQEQARADSLAAQLPKQLELSRTSLLPTLVFAAGVSRTNSPVQQLLLDSAVQLVHIEIQLESGHDYARFRAELRRAAEDVLTQSDLVSHPVSAGYGVILDVPASALRAGEYELALKGAAGNQMVDVGHYSFRVRRR